MTDEITTLNALIVDKLIREPGAVLADICTGRVMDEAGRLEPGRGDRLINQRLKELEKLGYVYQTDRKWFAT